MYVFLPRVATQSAVMPRQVGRLSVRDDQVCVFTQVGILRT